MVLGSAISFISFMMVSAKNVMNGLWLCTWLGEVLTDSLALVEDPAWLEGPALETAVWLLEQAAEVDQDCSVGILVLFVAVWKCNGESGGELAVSGDLRSIARLSVFGRGVWSIGTLFEVSSVICSFLSPASPPHTVFSLIFLPSYPQCSIHCNFPLQLVVSALAVLTILKTPLNPFRSIPSDQCLP